MFYCVLYRVRQKESYMVLVNDFNSIQFTKNNIGYKQFSFPYQSLIIFYWNSDNLKKCLWQKIQAELSKILISWDNLELYRYGFTRNVQHKTFKIRRFSRCWIFSVVLADRVLPDEFALWSGTFNVSLNWLLNCLSFSCWYIIFNKDFFNSLVEHLHLVNHLFFFLFFCQFRSDWLKFKKN